jgi:hypothetical protein
MSKVVDLWHHQPNVTISVMRFLCECYHAIIITRRIESISIRAVQMVFCFSESLVMLFVLMEDDCWRIQCKPARSLTCTNLVQGNEQSAATVFALEYSPYIIMTQLWRILSKWHYKWHYQGILRTHWDSLSQIIPRLSGVWIWLSIETDAMLCSLCANTIDHLATFYLTFNGMTSPGRPC